MDVADLPTLHFTIESCERCDMQLRVGVGLPGEPIELVSPGEARGRTNWLVQATINRTNQPWFGARALPLSSSSCSSAFRRWRASRRISSTT